MSGIDDSRGETRSHRGTRPASAVGPRLERSNAAALVWLGCLLAWACDAAPAIRPNVLLVTVDALRADRLSGYGYERSTSPELDAFFESAVVFEDAQANASWTLGSLASIFTSTYPRTHQCLSFASRLDDSFRTLSEILSEAGYHTAGIASHTFLAKKYGLPQGFAEFDDELVMTTAASSHRAVTSPAVTDKALAWLRARGPDSPPWLLWVHYFDPHADYVAHESFADHFGHESATDRYDGEIAFTDRALGRLWRGLAESGWDDSTVVIFVADHGEEFREHGGIGHGFTLYREVIHVPLAIRVPGIEPRRVDTLAQGVDLLPTLLDLLGLPGIEAEGRSLVPAMRGATLDPEPAVAQIRWRRDPTDALITPSWKLVREVYRTEAGEERTRWHLFDRIDDPGELENVAAEHPHRLARMKNTLEKKITRAEALRAGRPGADPATIDDEERERLRALGYVP